jgi:aldose 1-epimerase
LHQRTHTEKPATRPPIVDNGTVPHLTIASGAVHAELAPALGGRLAQLAIDDTPLLIGHSPAADPTGWGSYPMVPWAGRIRNGRFTFEGVEHQLPINFGDHAIHGVGFTRPWTVEAHDACHASLMLDLPTDDSWPFGGVAAQQLAVDEDGITMTITVTATTTAFPVSFGWHPWFRKPSSVRFQPTAMYRRDADHIAVDELVPVPPGPWDDCFTNIEPVEVTIDGLDLRLTSNCDIWVVYDMPDHATCIEPQTGPPDAFNIAVDRLEVGDSVSAWYRIARA